jgi:inorganic phosphate transporter, PiT family
MGVDILLIAAVVFGFYMAWTIGANDVANSMANAVGSKALTIAGAVVLAGICEFAGAFLAGSNVTDTVRKGIIDGAVFATEPRTLAIGLVCALVAAAVWLHVSSYFGLPVSTTHSIVGAITGFGLLEAGFAHVQWGTLAKIVASWFISPVAGGIIAYIIFRLISKFILAKERPLKAALNGVPICVFFTFGTVSMSIIFKGLKNLSLDLGLGQAFIYSTIIGLVAAVVAYFGVRALWRANGESDFAEQLNRVERVFAFLVVITACSVAFAHGANDVANAIGPLAGVVDIVRTNTVSQKVDVSLWILALGGVGIVVGLATYGYRVMLTIATKITVITPSRGVAADIGATITVLTCSKMGLPISTTHTLVGAIVGVGLARGITAIDMRTVRSVFTSWILTVPFVAVLTMALYMVVRLFNT